MSGSIAPPLYANTALNVNGILPLTALRNAAPGITDGIVYLSGYATPNDGGQGFFQWEQGDTSADDGGTVIAWAENPGTPGPNLFPNPATWTITFGSPTISSDGQTLSDATTEFWQATHVFTGLTIGAVYTVSVDYTLGAGAGIFVSIADQFNTTPEATLTPWAVQIVAASTSFTLRVGGQNAAATITSLYFGLAPGGRWVRAPQQQGICYPEWWGAKGDNTTDDTAAFNAAIAWASQFDVGVGGFGLRGRVELSPSRRYKCNGALTTIDPLAMGMGCTPGGAVFNVANNVASTFIKIIGVDGNQPYANNLVALDGFEIAGTNPPISGLTAVQVGGGGDLTGNMCYSRLAIWGCNVGFASDGSQAYFTKLVDCTIWNCNVNYRHTGHPTNAGEMMVLERCNLFNGGIGIDWNDPGGSLFLHHCSIDYNAAFIRTQGGAIRLSACHLETNYFNSLPAGWILPSNLLAPISCIYGPSTYAEIRLENCELIWTTLTAAPPLVYSNAPSPYGVKIIDPLWGGGQGWGTSANGRLSVVASTPGLSPNITGTDIALSNTNLTATMGKTVNAVGNSENAAANAGALPSKAGSYYFKMTINALATGTPPAGLALGLVPVNYNTTPDIYFQGLPAVVIDFNTPANNGFWTRSSHKYTYTFPATAGTDWWCRANFNAQTIGFSADGGTTWNNGNPDYELASVITALGAGTALYPACSLASLNDQVTFNFNPSTSGIGGLSGYNPWSQLFTLIGGGNVQVFNSKSGNGTSSVSYPPMVDISNSLNADPTFENGSGTSFLDTWFLSQDSATITSRSSGTNIGISIGTTDPHTGTQALQAVKAGAATTVAAFALMCSCQVLNFHSGGFWYAASANSLGTVAFNIKYAELLYYGSGGVPVFGQEVTLFTATITPTTTYQQKLGAVIQPATPPWATHVLFEFDMKAMAAGTLYIDDAEFYRY